MTSTKRLQIGGLIILAWMLPSLALASGSEDAARSLFLKAREFAAEANYVRACELFERSLELEDGVGTRFNLADCWEHQGKTASAWREFLQVAEAARELRQQQRARVADMRATALETQLSHLAVEVHYPVAGLKLYRDGLQVPESLWSVGVPVDPGVYRIEALAPGYASYNVKISIEDNVRKRVEIPELTRLLPAEHHRVTAPPLAREDSTEPDNDLKWYAAGAAVVSLGALAGGIAATVSSNAAFQSANAVCPDDSHGCTTRQIQQQQLRVDTGRVWQTRSLVFYGVSTASALTAGVLWWLSADSTSNTGPRMGPIVAPGVAGLWVATEF